MNTSATITASLRRITAEDNAAIANVIRQVSAEYGLTADKGYTVADPNLDELFELYSQPGSAYWVVEQDGRVVGGGVARWRIANRISANYRKCIL
jgi:putative acetyltransferase